MKKIVLILFAFLSVAFADAQNDVSEDALFLNFGPRINEGKFETSLGYERRLLGSDNSYSLFTALNYQKLDNRYVDVPTLDSEYNIELGGRKYLFNNDTSFISPFVGIGALIGWNHSTTEDNVIKNNWRTHVGATFCLGSEFFLGKNVSMSLTGKYKIDTAYTHNLFVLLGIKYYL